MDDLGITMLLQLILPKELTEYFEVRGYREEGRKIELMLEEKNVVPEGYKKEDLLSKGFYDPVIIQDFPFRITSYNVCYTKLLRFFQAKKDILRKICKLATISGN